MNTGITFSPPPAQEHTPVCRAIRSAIHMLPEEWKELLRRFSFSVRLEPALESIVAREGRSGAHIIAVFPVFLENDEPMYVGALWREKGQYTLLFTPSSADLPQEKVEKLFSKIFFLGVASLLFVRIEWIRDFSVEFFESDPQRLDQTFAVIVAAFLQDPKHLLQASERAYDAVALLNARIYLSYLALRGWPEK